jgi:hypothetical protein
MEGLGHGLEKHTIVVLHEQNLAGRTFNSRYIQEKYV